MQSAILKRVICTSVVGVAGLFASVGVLAQGSQCEYVIVNEWNSGYSGAIRIHNEGEASIDGWQVSWEYQANRLTNSWNAQLSGNNPYTASDMGWNGAIQPGQSVEFGFQVDKNGGDAEQPEITGEVCEGGSVSSEPASSASSVASSSDASSVESSSSEAASSQSSPAAASSSVASTPGEAQCNWYGTLYPLCDNQNSGWGWESNQSCIGESTCTSQPSPYGVVEGGSDDSSSASSAPPASSASSSSVSSSAVSSSSQSSAVSSSSGASSSSGEEYGDFEGGCDGYATRFWDCCKPHCGWSENVPSGVEPMASCDVNDQPLSDPDAISSCEGGDANTCHGLAPFAVSDDLSYGYAATSSGDVCGRCFQIQFTGDSDNAPGDPGAQALAGKQMVVQAINIGHDVSGGQIDIMIPGGGVGAFDGCSNQWDVSNDELGAQYGGFLSACKDELGYNASRDQYKSCVANRCENVFASRGLDDLYQGCMWFADWFEAADNPGLRYREVQCPAELSNASGMSRPNLDGISDSCN